MRTVSTVVIAIALFFLIEGDSYATKRSTMMEINLQIVSVCEIEIPALFYLEYNPESPVFQNMKDDIRVICGKGLSYKIKLDAGMSRTYSPRKLAGNPSSYTMEYNIYTEKGTIWGDGRSGTEMVSGIGMGREPVNHKLYLKLPAGQFVPSGIYTDVVQATVEF